MMKLDYKEYIEGYLEYFDKVLHSSYLVIFTMYRIGHSQAKFILVTGGVCQSFWHSVFLPDLFDGTVNVKLYADDIKIYFEIVNDASTECLQKA